MASISILPSHKFSQQDSSNDPTIQRRSNNYCNNNTHKRHKATMNGLTMVSAVAFLLAGVGTWRTTVVEGHGYLFEPASRNYWSNVHGKDYGLERGLPSPREYCFHCLNTNTGVCGTSEQGVNYGTLFRRSTLYRSTRTARSRTYTYRLILIILCLYYDSPHSHFIAIRHKSPSILYV